MTNSAVCLCALRSPGHDALKRFFGASLEAIFRAELEETAARLKLDLDPEGIPLFVSALGGIMEAWLLGLFPDTPENMVRRINGFLQSHIYGIQVLQEHGVLPHDPSC
ncbi:TetR-like C-terminal domain-containing protein [Pseudoflavonifractor phocaeensis]|uniref:TetR-like C-terminal domain-containing protein n=1 Tax=Pseudoflavonifractor phocaeensis TaxID=1870988 RepID=UPI001956DD66|nr:TetR-like C-terminal domain-containing protein [Pseudoflavonifractor phocaeensis]MBM6871118.1 TetR/AcrR family transcriptional regulator C-terminal domain-containing protein [Pseudoflavonifractor phocaeensis]